MKAAAKVARDTAERILAASLLLLASPALLLLSIAILVESGPPVFFLQRRVGQHGRSFQIIKLRSMNSSLAGPDVTAGGDVRVTHIGIWLRKYKLDELPQLWNIVAGQMSFIGPRPEVPRFVDAENSLWQEILASKPGLTDLSSLVYRDEERLLSDYQDIETGYRTQILPQKLALSALYLKRRSLVSDCQLLLWTVHYSLFPDRFHANRVKAKFGKE